MKPDVSVVIMGCSNPDHTVGSLVKGRDIVGERCTAQKTSVKEGIFGEKLGC